LILFLSLLGWKSSYSPSQPPPLSSLEMGEEGKRLIPRDVGGEEKHGIIIIKDEIVGAIHELPLRNTN